MSKNQSGNGTFMKSVLNQVAVGVFALLAIATLVLAIFNDKGLIQVRAQIETLKTLEADITRIQAENKSMIEEIQALQSDPATIEKLAREELKLVKPGEVVLVTPAENNSSTPPPAPQR
jgi:cell division protein FtsB